MPGKLTQVEAAKIMFAHSKVLDRLRKAYGQMNNAKWLEATEALGREEKAFADLIATLTDSDGL